MKWIFLIAVFWALGAWISNDKPDYPPEQMAAIEKSRSSQTNSVEPRKRQKERIQKSAWSYDYSDDPMSKGGIYTAFLQSSNTVNFSFPYNGAQHATLGFRTHPKYGKDVIFSIEKGQFLCPSYENCTITVRFDDDEASSFSAIGAADNSSDVIFIRNYSRFIGSMMKSKRVRIAANIYQEGAPVFEFNVGDFDADKYLRKTSDPE